VTWARAGRMESRAMAWIEAHQNLPNHPKVLRLAALMEWSNDVTVAKLLKFWWWCVDYAEDGDLRKHDDQTVAGAVVLNGDEGKRFVQAMVAVCLLDRKPYFRVHDWWTYFGPCLRAKYKRSPQKWNRIRDLYSDGSCTGYVTGTVPDTYPPTNLPTNPPTPPSGGGVVDDGMEDESFAKRWLSEHYRDPTKLCFTNTARSAVHIQFTSLIAQFGRKAACEAVSEGCVKPDVGEPVAWARSKLTNQRNRTSLAKSSSHKPVTGVRVFGKR
jgi:hypothetical protein